MKDGRKIPVLPRGEGHLPLAQRSKEGLKEHMMAILTYRQRKMSHEERILENCAENNVVSKCVVCIHKCLAGTPAVPEEP